MALGLGPGEGDLLVNTIVVATQAQNKVNLELNKFNQCKKRTTFTP